MAEPISVAIPIAPKVDLTGLPDKFSGQFFKRWQQRMKIWLTMKGFLTVIQVTRPEPTDTDPKTAEIAQWTERDQIGRRAILSALSNTLFDVYCSDSYTAKSLWIELDREYNTEEQGLEKYSVSKFMRYQMVEDSGQISQILGKFWHDTQTSKGRLSLDDLMIAISIEEEHRNQTIRCQLSINQVNLIVGKQRVNKINSNSKAINKGKTTKNKKPKANKPCWNCGQVGHWAKLCPNKKAKTGQTVVNMVVGGSSGASTSGAMEGPSLERHTSLTLKESDIPRRSKELGLSRILEVTLSLTISRTIRLVAKGFKQNEGIDYFDTYSPVARLTTIRVLIALASVYNLSIHQMDVKTAFLYGELEEEIYMDQPEGFVAHGNERKVCKLVKSLYGLKQTPKQWHEKFDQTILVFGFTVNENDKCIYCKVKGDRIIILCLYVDDILLIGSCIEIITETKSFLKNKFEMKDMGEADVILGIKLIRSTDGIAISQSHYVEKIIENFGYQNNRIAKTPYDSSYLANGTRPDISFSVSKLARYTSCPDKTHWGALDRVLRYLKDTVSLAIHYGRFPAVLEGYSDASWIAKNSGSNGCSGYVFTLCGGAVSWKSAKQTLITQSTFEAELCALDTTGTEAECLFGLLSQLPIVSQPLPPIAVHCDSQTTIAKVRSRKYNQKTKRHIQARLKSIRALVSDRVIGIDFVGTKDNVVDPLTK
ncbi:Retrovirus-related Pol polyprotein from transposon TNT 1-94 [Sesamum angolense]|uniref:Retrovirus-related Pol polyprotein from transposon TNT 1-94 n=1 Tax=Sesamum angolense TaxID=2727404 RepID=A0AAE1WA47_9LAMI|nr:Retrovirus-related Pol polyprotein from transposon TNT 1-94 [Sesamum angolense]